MSIKKNCWEFLDCGREPGGKRTGQLGICPATVDERLDGINGGKAGGRACWTVEDTLCSGTIGNKSLKCIHCRFFIEVSEEERHTFLVHHEEDQK